MRSRIRLLLLSSSPASTRLIVCDDERVILDEEVPHDSRELSDRKEHVLGALHYKGMNLTRFNAVAAWAGHRSGRDGHGGGAPASGRSPGESENDPTFSAFALASAISGQLNIPCFWLSLPNGEADAGILTRRAVQIYHKGV